MLLVVHLVLGVRVKGEWNLLSPLSVTYKISNTNTINGRRMMFIHWKKNLPMDAKREERVASGWWVILPSVLIRELNGSGSSFRVPSSWNELCPPGQNTVQVASMWEMGQ